MAADTDRNRGKCLEMDLTSTYSKHLVAGLHAAQVEGLLTDVTIKTSDQSFSCHKLVLIANSDYFKVMFTSNFQEKEASEISLPSINGTTFGLLHNFLYTGKLSIMFKDLQPFLLAADFLQMSKLTEYLSKAIVECAKDEDCITLYTTLKALETYQSLVDNLKFKICRDFDGLCKTQAFLNLSKDDVVGIITDERLVISCERILFDAVMLWYNQNMSARTHSLVDLLEHVRLPLISVEHLSDVVEPALRNVEIPSIKQRIKKVKSYHAAKGIMKYQIPLPEIQITPRKLNTKIMLAISVSSESDTRCTIFQLSILPSSFKDKLKLTKIRTLDCRRIDAMSFTSTSIFYLSSTELWQLNLTSRSISHFPLENFFLLSRARPVSSKLTSHHNLVYAFIKSADLQKNVLVFDPSHEHFEVCKPLPGFDFTWENLISCSCGVFIFVKMFPTKVIHCYQYHPKDDSWSTHDLQNTEELYMIGSWGRHVYFCAQQETLYSYDMMTKKLSQLAALPPVDFIGDRTFIQTVAVDGHIYQLSLDKNAVAYTLVVCELIMEGVPKPYWKLELREPVVPILQTDLYPFQCSDRFGVQLEAFVV
ncbi:uncharacterized protein [Antedon mediterranea]|uniref:uncharacterized protein n=1 Tax=Antedon mediterranea TaxID=105859 RepID=UPI003AF5AD60